ncbi:hypothetical protein N9118_07265 [Akkermansiaceae bacterium]|nr:hypothetical protein [bacterium]MDB4519334.1 hypothetical protein [Akkermansiaceae bacterium]
MTIVGLLPKSSTPVQYDDGPKSELDDENSYACPNTAPSIA